MILKEARELVVSICYKLQPYCDRINIAGSVRRKKYEVKDLEIVCLPKSEPIVDLFGSPVGSRRMPEFAEILNKLGRRVKGKEDGRMMQVELKENIMLDLFIADSEDNYGNIYLIRTGDWEFSKFFMGTVLRRNGFCSENGYVKKEDTKEIVPTPDEQSIFDLAGIKFIEPQNRNLQTLQKLFYESL